MKIKKKNNFRDSRGKLTRRMARQVIIETLDRTCAYCGTEKKLDIHHVMPLYLGGTDRLNNFELICGRCHREIHKQLEYIFPTRKLTKFPSEKEFRKFLSRSGD